jgi:hypothetical protein
MLEGTVWVAAWNPMSKSFSFEQVDDVGSHEQGVLLEILHNRKGDRLYVTTAKPGHVNIYDNKDPRHPRFLQAIATAAGAHHMALSSDEGYLFVQNSFLNLEGMSDGSISVVDLVKGEVVGSVDTLKNQGFNPNCIVLLPNDHR